MALHETTRNRPRQACFVSHAEFVAEPALSALGKRIL
jgi:hypothetical protein